MTDFDPIDFDYVDFDYDVTAPIVEDYETNEIDFSVSIDLDY